MESVGKSVKTNICMNYRVLSIFSIFEIFHRKSKLTNELQVFSIATQIKAWQKASRKMGWGIQKSDFEKIKPLPHLTTDDIHDGFIGSILCYGFGDDGKGNSEPVLSGQNAWDFACRTRRRRTWQCEYIDFTKKDHIRLRPFACPRPKGFYWVKFSSGSEYKFWTVNRLIRQIDKDAACGPEGIQLLAVTHPHFSEMMNQRLIPFMSFADYDVAPYGYGDFFDAVQMFCSNGILGLGIGNVDQVYPLFSIPILRFPDTG